MKPEISKYMREMQRHSSEARWVGLSAAERSAKMKALRAKGIKKRKRVAESANAPVSDRRPKIKNPIQQYEN
jgi:hypothetical protein